MLAMDLEGNWKHAKSKMLKRRWRSGWGSAEGIAVTVSFDYKKGNWTIIEKNFQKI